MSLASEMLLPYLADRVIDTPGILEPLSIADTITSPTSAFDLSFDDLKRTVILDFRDRSLLAERLAGDASRFAIASFQTSIDIDQAFQDTGRIPWGLIRIYYAAFYAGNALIRIFGESCSWFDRVHAERINSIADLLRTTQSFPVEAGLYVCSVQSGNTSLNAAKVRPGSGGTHEVFWNVFGRWLDRSGELALRSSFPLADSQAVYSQLFALKGLIRNRGESNRLSMIRNEIQYRQQYEVWHPSKTKDKIRKDLRRISSKWQADPMTINLGEGAGRTLYDFVIACTFIISFCQAMFAEIASRSPLENNSFASLGAVAYLKQKGVI